MKLSNYIQVDVRQKRLLERWQIGVFIRVAACDQSILLG